MTTPTTLDPRPATEIKPPNYFSPPKRLYLSRDERRTLSQTGAPTLPKVNTYASGESRWPGPQRTGSTSSAPHSTAPTSARPDPLVVALHYTPNSAFTYPMKDKGMDLTIERDHGRVYTWCRGMVCEHQGHKTPALTRPPLVAGVGVPSFRPPVFSSTYCRDHRRFDCPLHAAGASSSSSVTTVDLPDIGDLDLPPAPVTSTTPALFVTDSAGETSAISMSEVLADVEGVLRGEAAGRAYRQAAALAAREPWIAGHFV